jgi:SAM-dependent methyltransferase
VQPAPACPRLGIRVWRRPINTVSGLVFVDAVVNIESSHCYESMDTFLSEACRVLRPGGRFFFADLRKYEGVIDEA